MSVKRLLNIDTGFARHSNLGKSKAGFSFDDFMEFFAMIAGIGIQGKADFLISFSVFKEKNSPFPYEVSKKPIEEALPLVNQFAPFYSVPKFDILINFPIFGSINPEFEVLKSDFGPPAKKKHPSIFDQLLCDVFGVIGFTTVKIASFYPTRILSNTPDEASMFGGFVYAEHCSYLVEFEKLCGEDGPFKLVSGVLDSVNQSCFGLLIDYIENFIKTQKLTIVGKPKFSFKEGDGPDITYTPLNRANVNNVCDFKARYCLCREPEEGKATSEAVWYVFSLKADNRNYWASTFQVTMNRAN